MASRQAISLKLTEYKMTEGLDINLESFKKMKATDRDVLIYQNVLATKKQLSDYKLHRKINYSWLTAVTAGLVFIGRSLFESK